jgi:ACS family hexuronate transporter-like MFS transporter
MTDMIAKPPLFAVGYRRWIICGLLFSATAINYIDRQIIGVLKPTLQSEYGWTETDYGMIVFWFQTAYAIGYLGFGSLVDRVGAKLGYTLAVVIWTIAHMAHAAAGSITGFILARFALGLGESGNFPSGLKAVAEWFPKRERAFATGLFNAGSNVGAIITPLIVPAITLAWGWRAAFIITGLFTVVWLVAWLWVYKKPRETASISESELAYIESDPPDAKVTIAWRQLIWTREAMAFAIAKFLTDPIWWMFLFWLPDFFAKRYGLDLKTFGPPLVAVYILSDVGSIAGGWLSSRMIAGGASLNRARKMAMTICACLVLPIMGAMYADNLWLAVAIVGLATAAHQGLSANIYTLPSDLFPRSAVGTIIGFGGTIGAVGGMAMSRYAGWVLDEIGSYTPIFVVAGSVYLLAVLIVHLLVPTYTPLTFSTDAKDPQ